MIPVEQPPNLLRLEQGDAVVGADKGQKRSERLIRTIGSKRDQMVFDEGELPRVATSRVLHEEPDVAIDEMVAIGRRGLFIAMKLGCSTICVNAAPWYRSFLSIFTGCCPLGCKPSIALPSECTPRQSTVARDSEGVRQREEGALSAVTVLLETAGSLPTKYASLRGDNGGDIASPIGPREESGGCIGSSASGWCPGGGGVRARMGILPTMRKHVACRRSLLQPVWACSPTPRGGADLARVNEKRSRLTFLAVHDAVRY